MKKKPSIRIWSYIAAMLLCSFSFLPVSADCKVEVDKYIPYTTASGSKPAALGAAEKGLGKISKKVLSEIALQAIKKASGLLTLAENLKTDKAFRHVHIVYIYRFVHHGKVESEWKIGHMTNISRSGVDYHPPKDISYVVKEGKTKIKNLLEKQLKEDCKNHQ
ncbi:hypothetical protein [Akkermansia muciniphila]|uniref:hypothetical protein n=1 Tax=Akkermansia muciniphila TaxID=239935 RepID=UPI000FE36D18|nr:hypothetical protein [Akkermansia muciniphila]MBT8792889.1 hypothetical protein [Akkermansia muciniphila]MCI7762183.1 hypothetical protein [Akkermansia muciniphila]MDY5392630.1 hypothetical protein [Akkermansia muciniphila]